MFLSFEHLEFRVDLCRLYMYGSPAVSNPGASAWISQKKMVTLDGIHPESTPQKQRNKYCHCQEAFPTTSLFFWWFFHVHLNHFSFRSVEIPGFCQVSNVGLNSCSHHLFQENHLSRWGNSRVFSGKNGTSKWFRPWKLWKPQKIWGPQLARTWTMQSLPQSKIMKSEAKSDMDYGHLITFGCYLQTGSGVYCIVVNKWGPGLSIRTTQSGQTHLAMEDLNPRRCPLSFQTDSSKLMALRRPRSS